MYGRRGKTKIEEGNKLKRKGETKGYSSKYSETCLIGPPLGPKFVVLIKSAYIKSCIK